MNSKAQVMAITAGDSWLEKGEPASGPPGKGGWSKSSSTHDGFDARIHNACDGSSPTGFLIGLTGSSAHGAARRKPGGDRLCGGWRVGFAPVGQTAMPVSGDTLLRMSVRPCSSRRKRRVWSASATGLGVKDSATERSSAI